MPHNKDTMAAGEGGIGRNVDPQSLKIGWDAHMVHEIMGTENLA